MAAVELLVVLPGLVRLVPQELGGHLVRQNSSARFRIQRTRVLQDHFLYRSSRIFWELLQ